MKDHGSWSDITMDSSDVAAEPDSRTQQRQQKRKKNIASARTNSSSSAAAAEAEAEAHMARDSVSASAPSFGLRTEPQLKQPQFLIPNWQQQQQQCTMFQPNVPMPGQQPQSHLQAWQAQQQQNPMTHMMDPKVIESMAAAHFQQQAQGLPFNPCLAAAATAYWAALSKLHEMQQQQRQQQSSPLTTPSGNMSWPMPNTTIAPADPHAQNFVSFQQFATAATTLAQSSGQSAFAGVSTALPGSQIRTTIQSGMHSIPLIPTTKAMAEQQISFAKPTAQQKQDAAATFATGSKDFRSSGGGPIRTNLKFAKSNVSAAKCRKPISVYRSQQLRRNSTQQEEDGNRQCKSCKVNKTTQWRNAYFPTLDGGILCVQLCNSCGIKWRKYRQHCSQCFIIPSKTQLKKEDPCECVKCGSKILVAANSGKPGRSLRDVHLRESHRAAPIVDMRESSKSDGRMSGMSVNSEDPSLSHSHAEEASGNILSPQSEKMSLDNGGRGPSGHFDASRKTSKQENKRTGNNSSSDALRQLLEKDREDLEDRPADTRGPVRGRFVCNNVSESDNDTSNNP